MPLPKFRKAGAPSAQGGSFEDRLSKMQLRWEEGKEAAKTLFERLPEGQYIGKLTACKLGDSSTSGKLLVKRVHTVTDGEFKGKNAYDSMSVETDTGFAHIVKWLEIVGVDVPSKSSELVAIVKKLDKDGYECKFSVVQPRDFDGVNVRVLELAEGAPQEEKIEEGQEVDLDSMTRKQLENLIKEYDLKVQVNNKTTDKDLRSAIAKAVATTGAETTGSREADGKQLLQSTIAFCESCGVEYDEKDDVEELTEKIKAYEFQEKDLDDDEKAVLNELGVYDDVVVKPKAAGKAKPKLKK